VSVALALTLTSLGLGGAIVAGTLGVGGAIVMVPLLLYVPPLLGLPPLEVKAVAGITMVQVLVAAASAVVAHHRFGAVHRELAWVGGSTMAIGSFAGAVASRYVDDRVVLLVFALMATSALVVLAVRVDAGARAGEASAVPLARGRAVLVCLTVGALAGLVGAGGAFLLVPLLITMVGVPIRVTIGTSLAITAISAVTGFGGKLLTGQIPWAPALCVALGAVPGAQLGALASRRLSGEWLRRALFVVVLLTATRVWWDLLHH
jgi:uncharacterized protein